MQRKESSWYSTGCHDHDPEFKKIPRRGLKMDYTQNKKISQISPSTLIIGIDIAKDKHVARAQDDRGIEFGKNCSLKIAYTVLKCSLIG